MKIKHLLFTLAVLTACNKDDAPAPVPTVYAKWRLETIDEIIVTFKDGSIIQRDTTTQYGSPGNIWEFKEDGTLTVTADGASQTTTFTWVKDTITIQPGNLYPHVVKQVISKLDMMGDMQFQNTGTTIPYGDADSAHITDVYNFTR